MPVTAQTKALTDQHKIGIQARLDAHTAKIARAWGYAWGDLEQQIWEEIRALQKLGRLADGMGTERVRQMFQTWEQLVDPELRRLLAEGAGDFGQQINANLTRSMNAAREIIQSQLPPSHAPGMVKPVSAEKLSWIADRATQQVTVRHYYLQEEATAAMKRELFLGLAAGDNPLLAAERMVDRAAGVFNGGLTRATVIARTEMLDAHRAADQAVRVENKNVLEGWVWWATLSGRTCPACWSMHGTKHPVDEPGPLDHHQGRCVAMAIAKTWDALGFKNIPEPPSIQGIRDAHRLKQVAFMRLPETQQKQVLGAARHAAWKAGDYPMEDWARRVEHYETGPDGKRFKAWRDSYHTSPAPAVRSKPASTETPTIII